MEQTEQPQPTPLFKEQAKYHQDIVGGRTKRRNTVATVLIIIVILSVAFLAFTAITYGTYAYTSYTSLKAASTNLESAKAEVKAKNLKKAKAYLDAAHEEIGNAKGSMAKLAFIKTLPVVGTQYEAAVHLVNATYIVDGTLSNAVDALDQIVSSIQGGDSSKISFATLSGEQKGKLLTKLHEVSPLFDGSVQDITLAEMEINKVPDSGVLRQIAQYSNELKRLMPTLKEGMSLATSLSKIGPDLAGYKQEKRYLVLFLNNSELRPGGGFIGSYGIMTVKNGEIVNFPTQDSWILDQKYPGDEPPEAIKIYMNPKWWMRDSNWSPDFPTSAETVLGFYRRESKDKGNIDGVIGLTPNVIENFIKLTGPITVPGYPYTFTDDHFADQLDLAVEYDYEKAGLTHENRKQILGDLNKTILDKILSLPQDKWNSILQILNEDITNKQIMVYPTKTLFEYETINAIIQKENWDGHILDTDGDYLMVADANLLGMKTDPVMDRTIDYHVQLTGDNKLKARLVLTYKHTGFKGKLIDNYNTYTRILVPEGSKFINGENLDSKVTVGSENGKTTFGFYESIHPQDTKVMILDYELPLSLLNQVRSGAYKLLVQKELGSFDHKLRVTFQSEKRIIGSEPIEIPFVLNSRNEGTFEVSLSQDLNFTVKIQ